MAGKPWTTERRLAQSLAMKGEGNPMYGKPRSEATKEKIRKTIGDSRRGPKGPNWGRKYSAETRKKMSLKKQGVFDGEKNPRWIANRDYVTRSQVAYRFSVRYLNLAMGAKISDELMFEKLGYTRQEFYDHFDHLLKEQGWTWEQHGLKGWHIDHIKPISAFVKEGVTDLKIINALNNLQSLWCTDNWKKGSKVEGFVPSARHPTLIVTGVS